MKRHKSYIEFYLALHCNLKCKNCSMASPYFKPQFNDYESFKRDCDKLNEFYQIDIARFTGGEASLHPDIVEFIKYPKKIGLAYKSCVITNGIGISRMPDEFWEHVDIINFSVYEGVAINYEKIRDLFKIKMQQYPHLKVFEVTDPEVISKFAAYSKDIASKGAEVNINPGMFKKIWTKVPNTIEDAQVIWEKCWMKDSTFAVHEGRFYKCPIPLIKTKLHQQENIPMPYDYLADSVDLFSIDAEQKLDELLSSDKCLNSCITCNGFNTAQEELHSQLSRIDIGEIL